ncbi:MAG: CRISPR-associated protein Cas5 [Bacilli bacterium]
MKRIIIENNMAHFGEGFSGKTQKTLIIPNPSSIVGILENLYDIDKLNLQFNFGYFIEYSGKHFDFMSVKKDTHVNGTKKIRGELSKGKRDNMYFEYLNDVKLVIYTDIDKDLIIKEPLRLGSIKCLSTLTDYKDVELVEHKGYTYNQLAKVGYGDGIVRPSSTVTWFDDKKGYFDYIIQDFQECIEILNNENYDEDLDVCINLFEYNNGKIK